MPSPTPSSTQTETGRNDANRVRVIAALATTVAVLLIAGVLAFVVFVSNSQDEAAPLPDEIVRIVPGRNGQVLRQDSVGVVTIPTWSCQLTIDGVRIPEAQLSGTNELGECFFRPGAEKVFESLEPGPHTIQATVYSIPDPEDRRSYTWTFTSQ